MKRRLFFVSILIVLAASLYAETVLIASENTGYKKALVKSLIEKLGEEELGTELIDHRKDDLMQIDPADYKAVYILNSGVRAQVRPPVLEWLNSISGRDSNVILHTTQTTVWTPPVEVDSITSASKRSNIDELTDDIVLRIKALQ
ncbi:MAG: hypothetical protein PQJ61_01755 [Spirochaetales bacterium]|uniref:Flavodoxin-like domain-containing protein n=1 Tax=Candidatus Thalassospirochaeta sargassi TaxID=3119039 RepID=A0AAJ1ML66_9SPIO|nr:hypothetical protein [Spirochaetales bacterium]